MAKCKSELDQFANGLKLFGFLEMVKNDPDIWESYFMYNCLGTTLTPGEFT